VTGATGGIGGAIVRDLASTHRVVAVSRDEQALARLAAEIGRHLSGAEIALLPAPETPPGSPIGAMGQVEECWHCVR